MCRDEDAAAAALQGLTGRFYNGRPILVEFSPVTDFREATCRQYEENTCTRGGYCNFMHLRPISKSGASFDPWFYSVGLCPRLTVQSETLVGHGMRACVLSLCQWASHPQ